MLFASVRQNLSRFATTMIVAVGLLGVAWPAEAQIVYTPTNITIGPNGSYNLDVNNDGVTDFTISTKDSNPVCPPPPGGPAVEGRYPDGGRPHSLHLATIETPASGNGAEGKGNRPARLINGDQIGPSQTFPQSKGTMAFYSVGCPGGGPIGPPPPPPVSSGGNWLNSAGYLGLSFQVDGQTYYGWAYLTVGEDTATLTGYAYENTPGTPINAGQTTDADDSSALRPGPITNPAQAVSQGTLALCAQEVPLWRKKELVRPSE